MKKEIEQDNNAQIRAYPKLKKGMKKSNWQKLRKF